MKHLLIIGARGFGREVYYSAIESIGFGTEFDVKGFLDDKADALEGYAGYPSIISSVENYEIQPDDVFICALGDVAWKRLYVQKILDKGGEFISLIHKSAQVCQNAKIGVGCVICRLSIISCDVKIGNYTTVQPYVIIGHDTIVGDMCHINSNASVGGFVLIEEGSTLHTSAVLLPKAKVHANAIVGAGSVVLRSVKANTTVFGNPAVPVTSK